MRHAGVHAYQHTATISRPPTQRTKFVSRAVATRAKPREPLLLDLLLRIVRAPTWSYGPALCLPLNAPPPLICWPAAAQGAYLIVDGVVASPHSDFVLDDLVPAAWAKHLPAIYEVRAQRQHVCQRCRTTATRSTAACPLGAPSKAPPPLRSPAWPSSCV